jgi:excisionase family DNA binding protein
VQLEDYDDILTIDDMRDILKVGRNAAYDEIKSGRIPHFRVGRQIRIYKKTLMEVLDAKGQGAGLHKATKCR